MCMCLITVLVNVANIATGDSSGSLEAQKDIQYPFEGGDEENESPMMNTAPTEPLTAV